VSDRKHTMSPKSKYKRVKREEQQKGEGGGREGFFRSRGRFGMPFRWGWKGILGEVLREGSGKRKLESLLILAVAY